MKWSVIDLGGVVGTFINGIKVQSNTPHNLNCGDLIGVGCPENKSCREKGKETYVFKLQLSRTSHEEKDQDGSLEDVKTSSSSSLRASAGISLNYIIQSGVGVRTVVFQSL